MAQDSENDIGQCVECNRFAKLQRTNEGRPLGKPYGKPHEIVKEYQGHQVSHGVCPNCAIKARKRNVEHWYWKQFARH